MHLKVRNPRAVMIYIRTPDSLRALHILVANAPNSQSRAQTPPETGKGLVTFDRFPGYAASAVM